MKILLFFVSKKILLILEICYSSYHIWPTLRLFSGCLSTYRRSQCKNGQVGQTLFICCEQKTAPFENKEFP